MRKIFYLAEISDNQDAVIYQQEESYGEQQTLQTEAVALMPGFFQKETDGDREGIYPMTCYSESNFPPDRIRYMDITHWQM